MCILNLPKTQESNLSPNEIQRYSRIEESNYRKTLNSAATKIQNRIRVYLAAKHLKKLKLEREIRLKTSKATIIQSFIRKYLAVKRYNFLKLINNLANLRESAATCIQKNYRIKLLKESAHKLYITRRLLKIRFQAATKIQKTLRAYLVRKDLYFIRNKKLPLLITWDYPAHSVSIAGDFTLPPWKHELPLIYSKHLKSFYTAFFIENNLSPGNYYIKFIVDSSWLCDGNMPIAQDSEGNFNNLVVILQDKFNAPEADSSQPHLEKRFFSPENELFNKRNHSISPSPPTPAGFVRDINAISSVKLHMSSYQVAHPKKRNAELTAANSADACAVSEEIQMFALADGVSEWETFGLDPSLFPNELVNNFVEEIRKDKLDDRLSDIDICDRLDLMLNKAYEKTKSFGSSTILLAICRNSNLFTLSLGDSAFLVLRKREHSKFLSEIYRSVEQQHYFNCPYQLSHLPGKSEYGNLKEKGLNSLVSLLKRSKNPTQDLPKDAHTEIIPLHPFDIIIAGSDGLFDNLYDEDIRRISEKFLELDLTPESFCEQLAKELTLQAIYKAWDSTYKSPFSKNASKYGKKFIGGKVDDTSVVVALAVKIKHAE